MSAAADCHTMEQLGMPSPVLMERAALCVSAEVEALADAREAAAALILVGPGNNGGDGLAIARQLHGRGRRVRAVLVTDRHNDAVEKQLRLARAHGVEVLDELPAKLERATIVVDAMLGTGSRGAPRGGVLEALRWLEQREAVAGVVAVDLPSGVDVDSGALPGEVVRADLTLTFQRSKPGLHLAPARAQVGQVVVADIGLVAPVADEGEFEGAPIELIDPAWVARTLAELPDASHKGRRGHVGVIGGTGGTPGAAILAASAAMRAGAGLATLAPLEPELRAELIERRPELMLAPKEQAWTITDANVLVVGPGLVEADADAIARLREEDARAMVWDASGLAHFGAGAAPGPRVITPHPGEAARVLARLEPDAEWTSKRVQADRRHAAERLACCLDAVVVLKGEGTLVAREVDTGVRLAVATTGSSALATAGTGDVLAGTIGALLARGLDPWTAACLGVHLHGMAGERSPSDGTMAMDIAEAIPGTLAEAAKDPTPARWPRLVNG
jgi:hydroxyethylthiazole kinase-like uncharacterized protein yjeF